MGDKTYHWYSDSVFCDTVNGVVRASQKKACCSNAFIAMLVQWKCYKGHCHCTISVVSLRTVRKSQRRLSSHN